MTTNDSVEEIAREILRAHGFFDNERKPGLFKCRQGLHLKLFVDMRKNRTQYYAYDDRIAEPITRDSNPERHADLFKTVAMKLATAGIAPLFVFDEKRRYCPRCGYELTGGDTMKKKKQIVTEGKSEDAKEKINDSKKEVVCD